jgi:hypothetical protein
LIERSNETKSRLLERSNSPLTSAVLDG